VTRVPLCIAVVFGVALSAAAARAAGSDDAQWPSFGDDNAQWPNVKVDEAPINPKPHFIPDDGPAEKPAIRKPASRPVAAKIATPKTAAPKTVAPKTAGSETAASEPVYAETSHTEVTGSTAEWPSVKVDETPINPKPAFVQSEPAPKSASAKSIFAPETSRLDVTGTNLAVSPKAPVMLPDEPQPSAFAFEAGARYWYSFGNHRFAFNNNAPGFGTPTSTLDWKNLEAHSGEVFFRVDHKPTGLFVKGLVGGGAITSGYIDDKDFFEGQGKFSDTRSQVQNGNLAYAMLDVGWAYRPMHGLQVGVFAGFHYWKEKATAYGLLCKQQQPALGCPDVGSVPIGYDTQVLRYEPTWYAVRLGADAKVAIDQRWSVSGEIAVVPYAQVRNEDSHLLRQDSSDLGPAPNVISTSHNGYGIEAEIFVNYALTPNIEIGTGLRYWGLFSRVGNVRFGPEFSDNSTLDNFDQQRYGVLAHIKGKF
jgi:outer membrane protease